MSSIHNELPELLKGVAGFPTELKPEIPLYLQKYLQSQKKKRKLKVNESN